MAQKRTVGTKNDLGLGINAVKVLQRRYLLQNERGEVIETPSQLFRRVAHSIASAEAKYGPKGYSKKVEDQFYKAMSRLEFLPNTPTLMNAGTKVGQLSACFVIPVGDSLPEIFDAVKWTAIIHQSGGGTGFSFSHLRPQGDSVKSTGGIASGPVMFMTIFDKTTEEIKQGGKRRGANMGILRVDHPDILEFIVCKSKEGFLSNFNISVAVTDSFMDAVRRNGTYSLVNPRNKRVVGRINARKVFDLVIANAWKAGDPGIIFIDRINKSNPTPSIGEIEATNPCVTGEVLISTNQGLVQMKDIVESCSEAMVATNIPSGNQKLLSFKHARAFKTGRKEAFKLETESGYEVTATADHKFLTKNGWKKLEDLTIFDELILQNSEGKFTNNSGLPSQFNDKKDWDIELGRVVGWIIGGGWIVDRKNLGVGFTFGGDDKQIFHHLKPVINKIYGSEIKEVKRSENVIHLSYHSKKFVEFFKNLGVMAWTSETKEVPSSIFTATREGTVGFLQGLFSSDGTVGCNKEKGEYYIRLSSLSKKLLKQVQILLINLGIKSKIYERHRDRRVTFSYENIKGGMKFYEDNGLLWELHICKDMIPVFLQKIGFLCNKNDEKLKKIRNVNFRDTSFTDRVFSKEPVGTVDVYDLTEPETHSFIANGIVVHNCGEQPLLPWESCNLGSINLSKVVKKGRINWEKLAQLVRLGVRFLDDVIDVNRYPAPQIERITLANRKIGIGVMGFADALLQLNMPYNSRRALETGSKIMRFIQAEGRKTSEKLGRERGNFPNFDQSVWKKRYRNMRNATVTTVAPTGTISIIAGCSSGIEPIFAVSYVRNVMEGTRLQETNPYFEKLSRKMGFYSSDLVHEISRTGSVREIRSVPKKVRRVFVTALDIEPRFHIKMQSVFQKYTDNAVSKTVNLPQAATPEDVRDAYLLAYNLGSKGVTVYRYNSKPDQVLTIETQDRASKKRLVVADSEFGGGCEGMVCPH